MMPYSGIHCTPTAYAEYANGTSTSGSHSARSCWRHFKDQVKALKQDVLALYYAAHDPRTPWLARLLPLLAVAYALSPLDLIPDFIPVLGLLDDLLLLPVLIWLSVKLIPQQVSARYWLQQLCVTSSSDSDCL